MKQYVQALWRPTLIRRLLVCLILSSVLADVCLTAIELSDFNQTLEDRLYSQGLVIANVAIVAHLPNQSTVAEVMATIADQINVIQREHYKRPGKLLMQLRKKGAPPVFTSPELNGSTLLGRTGEIVPLDIGARPYWVVQSESGPWQLTIAEPQPGTARLLGALGGNITIRVLQAFPLVLLPMWIGLVGGLRPLRNMGQRIAARDPADLTPLQLEHRYEELAPLTTALDALLSRLRGYVQRERVFLHDAAHELRTPLAVISTQAHVLAHTTLPQERLEALAALDRALARTSHLQRQLLDLAAMDDSQERSLPLVDAVDLVQHAMAQCAGRAFERGLDLALDAPQNLLIKVDPSAFESVLGNLLDNALNYTVSPGHVQVVLRDAGEQCTLAVIDDGPGIAPALRERAFERFWRGAEHDVTGSGLGLAIVLQATQRMQGSVRMDSGTDDGRGLMVTVSIPKRCQTLPETVG